MEEVAMRILMSLSTCILIICLGSAAGASMVDHSSTGVVAVSIQPESPYLILTASGEVWWVGEGFDRFADWDPPMAVSQISIWEGRLLVTTSGDVWVRGYSDWINLGQPGGQPVTPSTWGQIKAQQD
jgi:hypothetical protein